jgi:hypothetical protein
MWEFICSNHQFVATTLLGISLILSTMATIKLRKIVDLDRNYSDSRHQEVIKRLNDLEFQTTHLSQYLQQKRQESMNAALKDATENPEKYVTGQFAIINSSVEEKP